MEPFRIVQALRLPVGTVQAVAPSLVHNAKVYAHEVTVAVPQGHTLYLDARQFPIDVTTLTGKYGEMVIYLTDFEAVSQEPSAEAVVLGRYLGLQISVVFFPALLTRYRFIEAGIGDYENIPVFQDDYARVSAAYHELGFPLEPYEEVPLFYTDFGVFVLGPKAVEELEAVAQVGEQVFFSPKVFSLVSFKELPVPS